MAAPRVVMAAVRYVLVSTESVPSADVFTKPADARFASLVIHADEEVRSVVDALAKVLSALKVLASLRSVDDAAVMVSEPPSEMEVPLMVSAELRSLLLAIEPASMVLVTVPVSVVYTPLVTVPALPEIEPVIVEEKVFAPEKVLVSERRVLDANAQVEVEYV